MSGVWRWSLAAVIVVAALATRGVQSQQPAIRITMPAPRPEPIADTKLLMDGITQANFNGLNKLFKEVPKDAEAWAFARGQALLIGESANLLMLRPPKSNREAQEQWMGRAAEMRDAAGKLALAASGRDYLKCRSGIVDLANSCNHCHKSFRIPTHVTPFAAEP